MPGNNHHRGPVVKEPRKESGLQAPAPEATASGCREPAMTPLRPGQADSPPSAPISPLLANALARWQAYRFRGACIVPDVKDGDTVIIDTRAELVVDNTVAWRREGVMQVGKLRRFGGRLYVQSMQGRWRLEACRPVARVVQLVREL